MALFLDEVVKLGVPEKNSTDSQDVSDEYYDLEARIKNKETSKERVSRLLTERTPGNKDDDVIKLLTHLDKVQEDLERLQGRKNLLENQVALTTVTVTIQEIKNYVPPQTPSFGSQIGNTFSGSIEVMTSVGRGLTFAVVALAPWLLVLLVPAVPLWLFIRHRKRSHNQNRTEPMVVVADPVQPPGPG